VLENREPQSRRAAPPARRPPPPAPPFTPLAPPSAPSPRSDARAVHVKEDAWPEDAFLTSGQLAHNYAVIPVGATEAFTYSVTPARAVDAYEHAPTFFTYEAVLGEKGVFTTSASPPLPARVYTARAAAAARALGVGARLTLGALTTATEWQRFGLAAAGLAAAALAYRTYTAAAAARTASKRRSALKGLGITEEELKKGK
jgi:hypothetical protein